MRNFVDDMRSPTEAEFYEWARAQENTTWFAYAQDAADREWWGDIGGEG